MAPMLSETGVSPSRRRTFITSCSPDELLGQIIQTLNPKYRIDAPYLLALRKVLSSAIVAPKKPPRLIRTRPDKRIGQIGSIYDTTQRSIYGPNGPPISTNASFYFHQEDPDFQRLLPQVDRAKHERSDEPASEGSQNNIVATSLEAPTSERKRTTSSPESRFIAASASAVREEKVLARPTGCSKETRHAPDHARSSSLFPGISSAQNNAQKQPATSPTHSQPTPMPTITITSADSERLSTANRVKDSLASTPLLQAADVFIKLPDSQETSNTPQSFSVAALASPCLPDTQDTFTSTQQSDVFSPPVDFLPCTPPTQEDSQSEVLPQAGTNDTNDLSTTERIKGRSFRRPISQSGILPEVSLSPAPSLNKRSHGTLEEADDNAPPEKRSKMPS